MAATEPQIGLCCFEDSGKLVFRFIFDTTEAQLKALSTLQLLQLFCVSFSCGIYWAISRHGVHLPSTPKIIFQESVEIMRCPKCKQINNEIYGSIMLQQSTTITKP